MVVGEGHRISIWLGGCQACSPPPHEGWGNTLSSPTLHTWSRIVQNYRLKTKGPFLHSKLSKETSSRCTKGHTIFNPEFQLQSKEIQKSLYPVPYILTLRANATSLPCPKETCRLSKKNFLSALKTTLGKNVQFFLFQETNDNKAFVLQPPTLFSNFTNALQRLDVFPSMRCFLYFPL